jgi:hypothetical protein
VARMARGNTAPVHRPDRTPRPDVAAAYRAFTSRPRAAGTQVEEQTVSGTFALWNGYRNLMEYMVGGASA